MRIAIVNNLVTAVAALRQVVQTVADYQIVWTATTGSEAVARCAQDRPDLILMDLLMPEMDGVEATRQIMQQSPCGILIVTANTEKHLDRVYEALCQGALDAINTPALRGADRAPSAQALLNKIATLRKLLKPAPLFAAQGRSPLRSRATRLGLADSMPPSQRSRLWATAAPMIVIGSSTGGPKALATVLAHLPVGCKAAIVVVQHVDQQFSAGLVTWLNQQINLPVRAAQTGESLEPGTVLVAGRNDHLELKPDLTLSYTPDPIDYPYRPSIDVFFKSVAAHYTRRGTAVLLTGMGRDGAEGLATLRQRGWHTIAQDKASCAVYGMPKAAAELNAAVDILAPEAISSALLQSLKLKR
jgi:two-component system, chemotaxis family, response regulator WspF